MDSKTFEQKTGTAPINDDLERVNCDMVGRIGHWSCGWCDTHDKPRFQCGCLVGDHSREIRKSAASNDTKE